MLLLWEHTMSYRGLTLDEAEAKLIASFSSLIWIVPAIFLAGMLINYNTGTEIAWSGSELASIFKGLLWLIFGLRLIRFAEKQLAEWRKEKIE